MEINNFFNHVNGQWLETTIIPDEERSWGTFNILDKENEKKLLDILNNTDNQKLLTLKTQYEGRYSGNYLEQIMSYLNRIDNCSTKTELLPVIWDLFNVNDIGGVLNISVYSDLNNADYNILHLSGSGIGLPDRDYYFDDTHKDIREKYKVFLGVICQHFGIETNGIFFIEEQLAGALYTKTERREPWRMNNVMEIERLETLYKSLRIRDMITTTGITELKEINVSNPTFVHKYNELFCSESITTWKNYYKYIFARKFATFVSEELNQLVFNFYSRDLSGVKKMKEEKIRTLRFVEGQLGMELSQEFTKLHFNEDCKKDVLNMIDNIKDIIRGKLKNNWMEPETKQKALEKLEKINSKIGYPDVWRDYSSLVLGDNLIENILIISRFELAFDLSELYQPVNKTLWHMYPHEVNAYYSPTQNEIVFPAGILQPPFYEYGKLEENYGGIGSVIGHEITHGFDDEGCNFDADGNLRNWWTEKDQSVYKELTQSIRQQYDELYIEGLKVDGQLTLGENIADIGGVSISWDAMKLSKPDFDGKKFFENYANIWKSKYRFETLKLRISTDPHSPAIFRVNQVLRNFNPFYNWYNISESSEMFLKEDERMSIW